MKQVLLSVLSGHHPPRPMAPMMIWMSDDTQIGDTFLWGRRILTVDAIYTTHLSAGLCQQTERPQIRRPAAVILDDHPS